MSAYHSMGKAGRTDRKLFRTSNGSFSDISVNRRQMLVWLGFARSRLYYPTVAKLARLRSSNSLFCLVVQLWLLRRAQGVGSG